MDLGKRNLECLEKNGGERGVDGEKEIRMSRKKIFDKNGRQKEIFDYRHVWPRRVCSNKKAGQKIVSHPGSNLRPAGPEASVFPLRYVRSSNIKWFE